MSLYGAKSSAARAPSTDAGKYGRPTASVNMPSSIRSSSTASSSSAASVSHNSQYRFSDRTVVSSASSASRGAALHSRDSVRTLRFDHFKSLATDYRMYIMDAVADHARAVLEEHGLSEDLANDIRALWEEDCGKRSILSNNLSNSQSSDTPSLHIQEDNAEQSDVDDDLQQTDDQRAKKRQLSLVNSDNNATGDAVDGAKRYKGGNGKETLTKGKQQTKTREKDLMSEELDSEDDDPSDEEAKYSHRDGGSAEDPSSGESEMSMILGLYSKVSKNKHKVWRIELKDCILQVQHGQEMLEVPMVDVKVDAEWK